jgi:hypothetical protein
MNVDSRNADGVLTDYEKAQVEQIAAWKSEPPNPFSEMFKTITLRGARVVERVIPDSVVEAAIARAYDLAAMTAMKEEVKTQTGANDLGELRNWSLEECDQCAHRVGAASRVWSTVEGAVTGAGGPITTLLDVPILFVLAIRTILRIGHCYGYALDGPRDRPFVLGLLLTATSNSLEVRRERLVRLRDVEDWLLEEIQQDIVGEEAASFLFQLEIFEGVPGVGAVSGAVLNLAFMRRVDRTARHVFQERRLRDQGKVDVLEPAEAPGHLLKAGWSGALGRAVYSGCYYLGFGVTLPAWFAASLIGSMDNPLVRGIRDGATSATIDAGRLVNRDGDGAPALPAPALGPA